MRFQARESFAEDKKIEKEAAPADCIVVLGRGIEQAETPKGQEWKSTRAIEKLTERGWHSGSREKELTPDAEGNVVVAGSNANVLASVELFEELKKRSIPPQLVIFAAGRPDYLVENPDETLTEGKILSQKFKAKTKETGAVDVIVLEKNKTTKDDIIESLRIAQERGLSEIAFITVSLHKDRAEEFLKMACAEHPEFGEIKPRFIASEELLSKRYSESPSASRLFAKHLSKLKESFAWRRTEERESQGLEDLRSGKYRDLQGPRQ